VEHAFLICAVVGGAALVIQLLMSMAGLGVDALEGDASAGHDGAHDGVHLLSVRALAAGLAFFGLAGMWVQATGRGVWLALAVAAAVGGAAAVAIALAMRQMMRLERDGTVHIEHAVGTPATVYLSIPGGAAPGKVHLALGGRTVEYQALSQHPIPTGAPVVVVDVLGPETVEVVPSTLLVGETPDAPR
jgi:membrane protein implicated in regulation of membrane protease activity